VGGVSPRAAVLWVRVPGPGSVTVDVAGAPGQSSSRLEAEPSAAADWTAKLALPGLRPGQRHGYRVRWQDRGVDGEFVTPPDPGEPVPLVLAWSGDLGSAGHCRAPAGEYRVFRALAGRRPDLFVFVGDIIYADHRCRLGDSFPGGDFVAVDLAGFHRKHRYNREDPAAAAFYRTAAVEAIWDDHDVRNDFDGLSEPLMPVGRRALLDYWPIAESPAEPGRLYRRLRWGRLAELWVLDTRQYRSPNAMADGPGKTMLGQAQRHWLLDGLRASDATWKLVVTSVSLSVATGRDARDGWANGSFHLFRRGTPTGFEHELGEIVRQLAAARVRNVVWLGADIHHAEVIRHAPWPGLAFHELLAGPLQAGTSQAGFLDDTLGPTRLYAEGGFYNFGELRIQPAGLEVRIIDADGRERFATTLVPEP
jgi:alkaline phosphatase D